MLDSKKSSFKDIIPIPRTIACFAILITILAFIAGRIRNELALTLLGTILLIILVYCFLGVFILGLTNRRKACYLSISMIPDTVNVGENGRLVIKTFTAGTSRFFKLPAILIRCELFLETKDNRVIRHFAVPDIDNHSSFPVVERGVYFGDQDSFVIFDSPGFFRLSLPIQQAAGPRFFALPHPSQEALRLSLKSGGDAKRITAKHSKSDELIDHRPYFPGDDPRRINWKLFSHSPLGELMVRKEDTLPPPHSRSIILIDTEVDPSLYTIDEGRKAVDVLCESVLSLALEFFSRGINVCIGYTGSGIIGSRDESITLSASDLAAALAWPAAVFNTQAELPQAELPQPFDGQPALIFALPRSLSSESWALEAFFKKNGKGTDIIFLYDANSRRVRELEEAARLCVRWYNRKRGVDAESIAIYGGKT